MEKGKLINAGLRQNTKSMHLSINSNMWNVIGKEVDFYLTPRTRIYDSVYNSINNFIDEPIKESIKNNTYYEYIYN